MLSCRAKRLNILFLKTRKNDSFPSGFNLYNYSISLSDTIQVFNLGMQDEEKNQEIRPIWFLIEPHRGCTS